MHEEAQQAQANQAGPDSTTAQQARLAVPWSHCSEVLCYAAETPIKQLHC